MDGQICILEVTSIGRPAREDLLALIAGGEAGLPAFLHNSSAARTYADKLLAHAVLVVGNAGLAALYANDERCQRAFVSLVVVKPSARGQGVGRALVSAAMTYLRDRGFRAVALEVRKDNRRAVSLYETLGFAVLGESNDIMTLEAAL